MQQSFPDIHEQEIEIHVSLYKDNTIFFFFMATLRSCAG